MVPSCMIPLDYYQSQDVVVVARKLLGKRLLTSIDGETTAGIIVETEAYRGPEDKACHAYGGRRTQRTEVMFSAGGVAYIYLCYGVHHLLNVVTGPSEAPQAVLLRALIPETGLSVMRRRRQTHSDRALANGPGKLTQAMGLSLAHNGHSLQGPRVWIEDCLSIPDEWIVSGPRVGIDYAQEWRDVPWRFVCTISHKER